MMPSFSRFSSRNAFIKHRRFLLTAALLLIAGCTEVNSAREQQLSGNQSPLVNVKRLQSGSPILDKGALSQLAKKISLLVEGPGSPGSAVILSRTGSKYYALTAWHVIKDVNPGEEIRVRTHDGKWHNISQASFKKFGESDLALFSFDSRQNYLVPEVANPRSLKAGGDVYVSGFPLPTASVPKSIHRFLAGVLVAYSDTQQLDGYDLLYSNPTLPGMSGGPVLTSRGGLIGIHGRAETDFAATEQEGIAIKTGVNQAIPITYALREMGTSENLDESGPNSESQELLAKATQRIESLNVIQRSTHSSERINDQKKYETGLMLASLGKQAIDLVTLAIQKEETGYSYYLRGTYKQVVNMLSYDSFSREDVRGDYKKAISLDPGIAPAYQRIADLLTAKEDPDYSLAFELYEKAISVDPFFETAYLRYGFKLSISGDSFDENTVKALSMYRRGLEKIPTSAELNYQVGRYLLKRDEDRARSLISKWEKEAFDSGTFDFEDQAGQSERFEKRAEAKLGLKKTREQALRYFDTSLEIRPEDKYGNVRQARAGVREDLGDYRGAISDLSTYIDSRVLLHTVWIQGLVRLYNKIGDDKGVIRAINNAMKLEKNGYLKIEDLAYARFLLARAKAYRNSGQKENACVDISSFVGKSIPISYDIRSTEFLSWAKSCGISNVPSGLTEYMD